LSVDEEAYFDGTSQRVNDPLGIGEGQLKTSSGGSSKPENKSEKSDRDSGEKLQPLTASSPSGGGNDARSGR